MCAVMVIVSLLFFKPVEIKAKAPVLKHLGCALIISAALGLVGVGIGKFYENLTSHYPPPATVAYDNDWKANLPPTPSDARLTQNIISGLGTKLVYWNEKNTFGTVKHKLFHLGRTFHYSDPNGNLIATGRLRIISLGSVMDITDAQGKKIATIKEDIWKSLLKVYTFYTIQDPNGNVIATSEKADFFGTEIVFTDPNGNIIARLTRSFLSKKFPRDTWNIRILNKKALHPSIFVLVAANKTVVDSIRDSNEDNDNFNSTPHRNNDRNNNNLPHNNNRPRPVLSNKRR